MKYARLVDGVVVEIIESENIDLCYHPDFISQLIKIDDSVELGMTKDRDTFYHKSTDLTIEQLREGMILTRLDAKLQLIERGLYTQINDAILAMPDCVLKIKWTEADKFKRTDVDLCDFLHSLGMTDEEIDELFNNEIRN